MGKGKGKQKAAGPTYNYRGSTEKSVKKAEQPGNHVRGASADRVYQWMLEHAKGQGNHKTATEVGVALYDQTVSGAGEGSATAWAGELLRRLAAQGKLQKEGRGRGVVAKFWVA